MKNRLTLIRSYTSMLWFDVLLISLNPLLSKKNKRDWHKLRAVSRQIHNHMKSVYLNKGTKADNLAENERLLNQAKTNFKNSI